MREITLQELLEAGCHFGHRVDRWHPKAAAFIYQPRDGIHIIDLAKTKEGLRGAAERIKTLAESGKTVLFVGTKRQARGVISESCKRVGASYLTNRWIGGFLTNWEEVKKNIDKLNRMKKEEIDGIWKKFPKHEQVKLSKETRKLEAVYGGVAQCTSMPDALVIVDIKKEQTCLNEAKRRSVETIAIVDTNADPNAVDRCIPANDDAVGSIQFITTYLTDAYQEGREIAGKKEKIESEKSIAGQERSQEKTKEEEKEKKEEKKPTTKRTKKKTGKKESA